MTDTERKELYTDRFCDIGNQIRWVFFDDHNGDGDHITVYCNYFDADLFEEAVNSTNPIGENPLDWLQAVCKQYGEDFFFTTPSEEDAAYEKALKAILSYDESAGLIAKGCTRETIEEIARFFGA